MIVTEVGQFVKNYEKWTCDQHLVARKVDGRGILADMTSDGTARIELYGEGHGRELG
jgi:hypothetical protein